IIGSTGGAAAGAAASAPRKIRRVSMCQNISTMKWTVGLVLIFAAAAFGQGRGAPNPQVVAARNKTEQELESIAIIERKLMVPMRDGKRMAIDVYRPKDTSKKYPIIFVRTPYNFNF